MATTIFMQLFKFVLARMADATGLLVFRLEILLFDGKDEFSILKITPFYGLP